MYAYYKEKEDIMDEYARKYRGEFTYHDFLNKNKLRMALLGFTELIAFSSHNIFKDLSVAFNSLGRGALSATLKNSLFVHLPLLYASTTDGDKFRYLDFMKKNTFLSLLLLPLQISAFTQYQRVLGMTSQIVPKEMIVANG